MMRNAHQPQAVTLYESLFDWQKPQELWERSESLKSLLGETLLATRDAGPIEIKKVLEAWVTGKTFALSYPEEAALVRVARVASMDAQVYRGRGLGSVEVTQALYPGRRRNVFGTPYGGYPPPRPIGGAERNAYLSYRDEFFRQAFLQVEARIEHKFQLYKSLDYLLVYVDLFDMHEPRFSYFALEEFMEEYADDLEARLQLRFRTRWSDKIGHLLLLKDGLSQPVTDFAKPAQQNTAILSATYSPVP